MQPDQSPQQDFIRDPLWYKDAIIYQLHIRAFYDSNGDGIGDFKGLIQKLDYLKDLGVNAIWVLPFYPSPLKDDGYDIADYRNVNSSYGDLDDFRAFVEEAHKRSLRVITELVINHTSDQHEWFQKARRDSPDGYWRNFYVWSDSPDKYKNVRIIFRDFETSNWSYDGVAKSYYWHRFYSHQPDLNFDNPEVKKQIFELIDYWMDMGVDGMRLDAVPYLFEREGTSCENLPETHGFLKELRAYLDKHYPDRMLLAEANQWPEDAVTYFGDGDECHMNYHFPIMPRLFMAVKREDRFSIIDIMRQTPDIPENCQWAMFLRNHDELTLEMVTDEERDYMYSEYASDTRARINLGIRRRLAPLLKNDRRQIELLNGLLFSMPGTPIIYYGDEIGMGDNIYLGDRNGVRTPFQWSPDRNAGFSAADPQRLFLPTVITPEYHYETVNVETQAANSNSLLNWTRGLIELRKQSIALMRGKMLFLEPANEKVLAFTREYRDSVDGEIQIILVLANLSKRAQYVELDLSAYKDMIPVELRGDTPFPAIGELPYLVTLGPYDFYWFNLSSEMEKKKTGEYQNNVIPAKPENITSDFSTRRYFESLLKDYLPRARWFGNKDQPIKRIAIFDSLIVDAGTSSALLFTDVTYSHQKDRTDTYAVTLKIAEGEKAKEILQNSPEQVIGQKENENGESVVYYEGIADPEFAKALIGKLFKGKEKKLHTESLIAELYKDFPTDGELPEPDFIGLDQSNSSLRFGEKFFFKLFRRLHQGSNPEIEIGQRITASGFANSPHLLGSLSYRKGDRQYSLAVLHEFIKGEGSAWKFFETAVSNFAETARTWDTKEADSLLNDSGLLSPGKQDLPENFVKENARAAELMHLLGRRTGEMHVALGSDDVDPDFISEQFTPFYQRSLYQSLRNGAVETKQAMDKIPTKPDITVLKNGLLEQWDKIETHFNMLRTRNFDGRRIRIHGDYHLGQIMFTGNDFIILDFEGEPMRSISTRRFKRSPLVDVAGLLRSIDYEICIFMMKGNDNLKLEPWLKLWRQWIYGSFMDGYMEVMAPTGFLPQEKGDIQYLIEAFLLEKVLYEIRYELSSRPDWVSIPLHGALEILLLLGTGREEK